jgi:hypothetical protein
MIKEASHTSKPQQIGQHISEPSLGSVELTFEADAVQESVRARLRARLSLDLSTLIFTGYQAIRASGSNHRYGKGAKVSCCLQGL